LIFAKNRSTHQDRLGTTNKRRESTQQKDDAGVVLCFSHSGTLTASASPSPLTPTCARKRLFFEPFIYKNDHFTKTGSTNIGKALKKRDRFLAGLLATLGSGQRTSCAQVARRGRCDHSPSFAPIYATNDHFTKTGSGQA